MHKYCLHPACVRTVRSDRFYCGRHWHRLPDDLRRRLSAAGTHNQSARGALRIEAVEHFAARMIGKHEVVRCGNEGCSADVVWLPTKRGRSAVVLAETVAIGDEFYEPTQHTTHFSAECAAALRVQR